MLVDDPDRRSCESAVLRPDGSAGTTVVPFRMDQCEPWYQGSDADLDGNPVGWRIYHTGAPAFGDPELHCPHAGPGGASVCAFPG